MYRPENWENPYEAQAGNAADLGRMGREIAYEAGADAMLEGLRAGVDRPYPNLSYPYRDMVALRKGIVVFIPDE